jgi:hypothetical protein
MSAREKLGILRARALALHERASVLLDAFTDPDVRDCAGRLMLGIDEELAWLDARGQTYSLPHLTAFLPGTTAAVALLEEVLQRVGRHPDKKTLAAHPELARALEDACAEPAARRARRPGVRAQRKPGQRPTQRRA